MTKKRVENEFVSKERKSAQEFTELVINVPKEQKDKIEGLINGFCLAASMLDNKKPTDDAVVVQRGVRE